MRNSDALDLHQVPVFASVPAKRLPELRRLLTAVEARRDIKVVREGDAATEFLVLTSGKATVTRGTEVVAELTAGDVFGEVGLLTGDERNATVVVDSGSRMYASNRVEFRTMLHSFPEIASRLADLAASRN